MDQMRAVVVDPVADRRLAVSTVDTASPERAQALVRVAAFSLNLGETRRAQTADAGSRPGWDIAGTVEAQAANGTGPAVGTRVVGLVASRGWSELVAVPTDGLAPLPDNVTFAQAATLPVAGLTALYALERGGMQLGRSVLVTGASGGVGHLATQLARHGGARVTATVRRREREPDAREAGAHHVVVGEDPEAVAVHGPYNLVLESVGGESLAMALSLLAPGGLCVVYGVSSGAEFAFDARRHLASPGAGFYRFNLFRELGALPASEGLVRLAGLVGEGSLRPHIGLEAPWTEIGRVAGALLDREVSGKAVLHVS
jgi:NADPH:quinone reductase-like Zn-dependent oxidoreductase